MSKLSLLALLLTTSIACSDPPNIGATCTTSGGCDDGLTCETAVPGGYCTAACTTSGSTDECPEAAVCDSVEGAAITCVQICSTKADCRADLDCNGVSGTNIKACKPKV
ncbi:MAG: hypothetical protein H0T79_03410 [Deltaproteobacteria bacterium]|nr:hypothetical protein [Deltaproteobacteria bacterium]